MKTAKQKKSGRLGRLVVFLAFMVIGAISGVWIARYLETAQLGGLPVLEKILIFALLILLLYLAMLVQIILHEAGHLVGGLMSGYRFGSYRIGGLMWVRMDGKVRLKRLSLVGTGGQCLMIPPEYGEKGFPVILYNLGGALMNLIAAAGFWVLHLALAELPVAALFCAMATAVGVGYALVNGLPLRLGTINNDGCNALELGKDPDALRSFWLQLKITEEAARGIRLKDMPESWFAMPSPEKLRNSLVVTQAVFRVNWLLDRHDFEEAGRLIDRLLEQPGGMVGLHRGMLLCDRLFLALLSGADEARIKAYCPRELQKYMRQMRRNPSVLRTGYAYTRLALHDEAQAEKLLAAFDLYTRAYPYAGDITGERELLELVKVRAEENGEEGFHT